MKRRTVIATAIASVTGGCLDRVSGGQTMPKDNKRSVRIDSSDEITDVPVSIEIELIANRSTDDHPAKFKIQFQNKSKSTMEVEFGPTIPFSTIKSVGGDVLLLPTNHNYSPRAEGQWEPDLDEDGVITQDAVLKVVQLPPEETVEGTYELWNAPDRENYLPLGKYHFQEEYSITYDSTDQEFDWEFVIQIE